MITTALQKFQHRALIALAFSLLLAPVASAATPPAGTVSESTTVVTWTGNPQPPTASADCAGPDNPACDNFKLTILPPSYSFAVDITITGSAADDYDLQVYDPAGALIGSSGNAPGSVELVRLENPSAGTYTVSTANFAAVLAFTGQAEIITADPPPPPSSGPGATFTIYPAPNGLGTNSGEPSLGSNWNTDKVMYIAGLETLRVDFNDCSSPAADTWEDVSYVTTSIITLDPILFTDPITGRTFASQLGPKCSSMAFTDDDGDTWTPSQGCGINSGVDHQTVGGGRFADPLTRDPNGTLYPHAVYYCSQDVALAQCARSDTGGLTFAEATPIYNITECSGLHGHVKVAPNDGTVYVPNKGCNGEQGVALSEQNGLAGTWEVRRVPGTVTGEWDPSVGIGSDGTLYIGMTNGGRPMAAVSTDKGLTWSTPFDVGVGAGVNGQDILNVAFPVVVAGDGDRAAFGFLGAEQGGDGGGEDANSGHVWYPYVAVTYDRGASWAITNLSPDDPVQRGTVCSGGTVCGGTRNLLDFNDMVVDREGRILFGYADGCLGSCAKQGPNSAAELATIARQIGGKRLFAAYDDVDAPAAPRVEAVRVGAGTGQELGRVSWDEPFDGNSPIVGYNLYRRADSETSASLLAALGSDDRRYDDTTIAAGVNYCYQVTAVNSFGESSSCGETCLAPEDENPHACVLPGIPVIADALDDTTAAAGGDASLDIEKVYFAEPFLGDGAEKLVVTIQVDDLSTPHPSAAWRALWNSPDGTTRYVSMESCDATTGIKCSYGTFDGTLFSSAGEPEGCSFDADGAITITVDKSLVGIDDTADLGAFLSATEARTQVFVGALCTGLLSTTDNAGPGENYEIYTNARCSDPNDPIANDDSAQATEGGSVVIDVLFNDVSFNGALSVVAVTSPSNGAVANNGDGTVTYQGDPGFTGVDTFTYTIEDEDRRRDSATVTVTVDPRCPPEAIGSFSDDFEPAAEDGWQVDTAANTVGGIVSPNWAVTADARASSPTNAFFSDAQSLDVKDDRLVAPVQWLSSTSQLIFQHRFQFEDTYDGGVLEVSVDDGSTWHDIVAAGGVFLEGHYNGTIAGNFGNPIAGRSAWTGGDSSGSMSQVTVDLGALAGRQARLRWRLGLDALAPGATPGTGWWVDDVQITDTLVQLPCAGPLAADDTATTDHNTSVVIDVLANDFHPNGDPIFVDSVDQPVNGSVVINGDDTVTYTPNNGFEGSDEFLYTICDPFDACDSAKVTVTVNPQVNRDPTPADDSATTDENTPVVIPVLANDSDPDGDTVSLTSVTQPSNGSATQNPDGTVTYSPNSGFFGTDTFTYTVSDGNGGSASANVTVTVFEDETTTGSAKVTGGGWIPGPGSDGKRNFGFNAKTKTSGTTGRLTYDKNDGGIGLKGTVDSLNINGDVATFSGPCDLDDGTLCTYTAVVEDKGEPGDDDTFSIEVYDTLGQLIHQAGDVLGGGNIQIH